MDPVTILRAPLRPSVVNSGLGSEQPNYEMRQKRKKPRKRQRGEIRPWGSFFGIGGLVF